MPRLGALCGQRQLATVFPEYARRCQCLARSYVMARLCTFCLATTAFALHAQLQGTPSAAPAVSENRVYIPTFAGAIESYEIKAEKPKKTPTTYRTKGSIDQSPVIAGDYLIWGTQFGAVSAGKNDLNANYRFMTRGAISAGLGYWPPLVFAASADGYIYAIEEKSGKRRWQFSTGYPAREMPVPLDGNCTRLPSCRACTVWPPKPGTSGGSVPM